MSLLKNRILQFGKNRQLSISRLPAKSPIQSPWICSRCLRQQRRYAQTAVDDPNFTSIVDHPAKLVRTGRKHGYGIIILGINSPSDVHSNPSHFSTLSLPSISLYYKKTNNIFPPSAHPHYRLRPRHLADPAPQLENHSHHTLRGPTRTRPFNPTPTDRPQRYRRLRLPPRRRHRPFPPRPGDARRSAAARRARRLPRHHAAGARRGGEDTGQPGVDRERKTRAAEPAERVGGCAAGRAGDGARAAAGAVEAELVHARESTRSGGVLLSGCRGDGGGGRGAGGVGGGDDGAGFADGAGSGGEGGADWEAGGSELEEYSFAIYIYVVSLGCIFFKAFEGEMLRTWIANVLPFGRYSLSLATSVMLWMVLRKPPSSIARRVRQNREW